MSFFSLFKKKKSHNAELQYIAKGLNALRRRRVPLYVDQIDIADTMAFLISEVDQKSKKLVLMSLTPQMHGDIFSKNQPITLATVPNNTCNIKFSCKIHRIHPDDLSMYTLHFPAYTESLERRKAARTKVGSGVCLQAVVNGAKGIPAMGYLHDVSKQGVCLCFHDDIRESLKIGGATHLCHLQLSDVDYIDCHIQLRHCYFDQKQKKSYTGAKFIDLSPDQQAKIDQLITKLQVKFYHRYLEDD